MAEPLACAACPHPSTDHDASLDPDNTNPCLVPGCGCKSYAEPLLSFPAADTAMLCTRCDRPLAPGDPIKNNPSGVNDGLPVVEVSCVYC